MPASSLDRQMSAPARVLRLRTTTDGGSRFEIEETRLGLKQFAPPAPALSVSDPLPAHQFVVLRLPVGWRGKRHPSPARQILFCLSGQVRVTSGIGEPICVGPGDVWLTEDTTGQGHEANVVSDAPFDAAIVQFPWRPLASAQLEAFSADV